MFDEAIKLNESFDKAGLTFHSRADALGEFRQGREITFDQDGEPSVTYDGENLPLSAALLRFGYDRRDLIDGRSLPRNGAGKARPGLASKSDLKTFKEKAEFIKQFGGAAYEALPLVGVQSSEVKTRQDWMKLPRQEKVRRLAADPEAFNKLPNAAPTGRVNGSLINQTGIDKHRAARPQRTRN
jgi:hypothetical protein